MYITCSGACLMYYLYDLSFKEQIRGALGQCTAAVHCLTEHASLLESERDAGQKALIKLEEKLSTSKAGQENSLEQERYIWSPL